MCNFSALRILVNRGTNIHDHQTKDPYCVKKFLEHRSIKNAQIYITIERTIFANSSDEYTVRIANKPDEIKALLEVRFEYVCEKDGLLFFKKRNKYRKVINYLRQFQN